MKWNIALVVAVGLLAAIATNREAIADPPRILYRSPRVVAYQLGRLTNEQLSQVPRNTNDTKYLPVYEALLVRPGLESKYREEALAGLTSLNHSDRVAELIACFKRLDNPSANDQSVHYELAKLLISTASERLGLHRDSLSRLANEADDSVLRRAALAAIVTADNGLQRTWPIAEEAGEVKLSDLISALPLLSDTQLIDSCYPHLLSLLSRTQQPGLRSTAFEAIVCIPGHDQQTFAILAEAIQEGPGREAAIASIRRVDKSVLTPQELSPLVDPLLEFALSFPTDQRDSAPFLDATALLADLLDQLPENQFLAARKALRGLNVSTVLIQPIVHQMLYDRTEFVVEAGSHVSIVFSNLDNMPHNLVFVAPGALVEVCEAAEAMAARPEGRLKGYVPDSEHVLWATDLLQPGHSEKLNFRAPNYPGIYPYACTYPGHWRRMFGAMIVVADRDAYHADPAAYQAEYPLAIKDELLQRRRSRTAWTLDQLSPMVSQLGKGHSFSTGKSLFRSANCVACHRLDGEGNELGPDLSKIDPKRQPQELLADILEPSKKIHADFATQVFVLDSGRTISGLVVEETVDTFRVLENPLLSCISIDLQKNEIETRGQSSVSIMPSGLLDFLTREEILELIAYLVARGDPSSSVFEE